MSDSEPENITRRDILKGLGASIIAGTYVGAMNQRDGLKMGSEVLHSSDLLKKKITEIFGESVDLDLNFGSHSMNNNKANEILSEGYNFVVGEISRPSGPPNIVTSPSDDRLHSPLQKLATFINNPGAKHLSDRKKTSIYELNKKIVDSGVSIGICDSNLENSIPYKTTKIHASFLASPIGGWHIARLKPILSELSQKHLTRRELAKKLAQLTPSAIISGVYLSNFPRLFSGLQSRVEKSMGLTSDPSELSVSERLVLLRNYVMAQNTWCGLSVLAQSNINKIKAYFYAGNGHMGVKSIIDKPDYSTQFISSIAKNYCGHLIGKLVDHRNALSMDEFAKLMISIFPEFQLQSSSARLEKGLIKDLFPSARTLLLDELKNQLNTLGDDPESDSRKKVLDHCYSHLIADSYTMHKEISEEMQSGVEYVDVDDTVRNKLLHDADWREIRSYEYSFGEDRGKPHKTLIGSVKWHNRYCPITKMVENGLVKYVVLLPTSQGVVIYKNSYH